MVSKRLSRKTTSPGGIEAKGAARPRRATLRDVASKAGVDPSIASRVLNGELRRVAPRTRDRIFAAASELRYRPNAVARSLTSGRTLTLGLLLPSLINPAYGPIIAGAERAAFDAGYVLLFADTSDDERLMETQITRLLGRVDGVIVASARPDDQWIPILKEAEVPFVLLNRRAPGRLPCVLGDDEGGIRLAVEHLQELGHSRIALVTVADQLDTLVRRRGAYEAQLQRAGRKPRMEWIVEGRPTPLGDPEAVATLFTLPKRVRPTGAVCVTFGAAVGAIAAARAAGLAVPADFSIVGFDDLPLAEHLWAPLTTIRMPHERMGVRAVELLLGIVGGSVPARGSEVLGPPELVVRGSTSSPPS